MRRFDFSETRRRPFLLARLLPPVLAAPVLAALLLFGVSEFHPLVHQGLDPAADSGSHSDRHPETIHFDRDSVVVPCLVCLFGFRTHSHKIETTDAITRPRARELLAAATSYSGLAELSYRLPLSRAPPFPWQLVARVEPSPRLLGPFRPDQKTVLDSPLPAPARSFDY